MSHDVGSGAIEAAWSRGVGNSPEQLETHPTIEILIPTEPVGEEQNLLDSHFLTRDNVESHSRLTSLAASREV